mgnify:CR=1 FL=1
MSNTDKFNPKLLERQLELLAEACALEGVLAGRVYTKKEQASMAAVVTLVQELENAHAERATAEAKVLAAARAEAEVEAREAEYHRLMTILVGTEICNDGEGDQLEVPKGLLNADTPFSLAYLSFVERKDKGGKKTRVEGVLLAPEIGRQLGRDEVRAYARDGVDTFNTNRGSYLFFPFTALKCGDLGLAALPVFTISDNRVLNPNDENCRGDLKALNDCIFMQR